jgi:hypothetical protein
LIRDDGGVPDVAKRIAQEFLVNRLRYLAAVLRRRLWRWRHWRPKPWCPRSW